MQPPDPRKLPNIRRLFIPDPGQIIGDADLDRADLQVVVWEADDTELKQMLHEGVDLQLEEDVAPAEEADVDAQALASSLDAARRRRPNVASRILGSGGNGHHEHRTFFTVLIEIDLDR